MASRRTGQGGGRPLSGASAPKGRPSLIDRISMAQTGKPYEEPAPVVPASHIKPTGETVSTGQQMAPVVAPKEAPKAKKVAARPTQTRPVPQPVKKLSNLEIARRREEEARRKGII